MFPTANLRGAMVDLPFWADPIKGPKKMSVGATDIRDIEYRMLPPNLQPSASVFSRRRPRSTGRAALAFFAFTHSPTLSPRARNIKLLKKSYAERASVRFICFWGPLQISGSTISGGLSCEGWMWAVSWCYGESDRHDDGAGEFV